MYSPDMHGNKNKLSVKNKTNKHTEAQLNLTGSYNNW